MATRSTILMLSSKANVYVSHYNVAHENRDSIQPQPQSQSTDHKKCLRYEGEQGFAADCIIKLSCAITSYKQKYISIESSLRVLTVEIALLYGQIDGELCSGWYEGDITPVSSFHSICDHSSDTNHRCAQGDI